MFDLQCYSSSKIFIKYSGAYDTSNHPTLLIQVQVSEVLQLQPGVRQQMPRHIFVNTNNEDIEYVLVSICNFVVPLLIDN